MIGLMTLEKLTAIVEEGLEKWPDGVTARCVLNGEAYQSFALAYMINGTAVDDDVIHEMARLIIALKAKRGAKYISWRRPFEWIEQQMFPEDMIRGEIGLSFEGVPTINARRKILCCRVLITANAADPSWPGKVE